MGRGDQAKTSPLFTSSIWPVIPDDREEARKITAPATSSSVAIRPSGMGAVISSMTSCLLHLRWSDMNCTYISTAGPHIQPGRTEIHPDLMLAELGREHPGRDQKAPLGHGVAALEHGRFSGHHGIHEDHRPSAGLPHGSHESLRDLEVPKQVDLAQPPPLGQVDLLEGEEDVLLVDVVHQGVDPAEFGQAGRSQVLALPGFGHVGGHDQGLAADRLDLGGDTLEHLPSASRQHDVRPLAGCPQRHLATQTRPHARHHAHSTFEDHARTSRSLTRHPDRPSVFLSRCARRTGPPGGIIPGQGSAEAGAPEALQRRNCVSAPLSWEPCRVMLTERLSPGRRASP